MKEYKPNPNTKLYLDYGLEMINSVPYTVSLRWVFYQIVQKYGLKKDKYNVFKGWVSKARKSFYMNWKPDTLSDDTREIILHGDGETDVIKWLERQKDNYCFIDKIQSQENYVMIWFEAKAMKAQFKHITSDYYMSLVPFGGDVSIPIKWNLAKHIEGIKQKYPKKEIIILYFGDCDEKGNMIPDSALKDIKKWCSVDFKYVMCGLTLEQAKSFDLIQNFDKPGEYQWEALSDKQARSIIISNLEKYWDINKIKEVLEKENTIEQTWKETMATVIDNLIEKQDEE